MAKKTLANLMTGILERAKLKVEDRKSIKAILDKTDVASIEIEDEDYDEIMGNLHSIDTATTLLKPKFRAEVLDGVDSSILEILGDGLADSDLDTIKSEKQTASKLRKAFEAQKKALETKMKAAKKEGDSGEEEKLRKEIDRITGEFKTAKETLEKEIEVLKANHQSELFDLSLMQKITSREDIAADFKTQRHFAQNFKADLNEFMQKNNIAVSFVDGKSKLLNSETKTDFLKKDLTPGDMDWVVSSVIKEYQYEKKSETPPKGDLTIEKFQVGSPEYIRQQTIAANQALNS